MTEGRRTNRVAETIKKYIAEALSRELFDPRLSGLILTRVEISPDLSSARVFFRTLAGAKDERERRTDQRAG